MYLKNSLTKKCFNNLIIRCKLYKNKIKILKMKKLCLDYLLIFYF
jgi:hypothetical protein